MRRFLALGISFSVAFVVAEVVARKRFGTPMAERLPLLSIRANPQRGWEMLPEVHYTYHHPVHVNRLGLRGAEIGGREEGEVRVLFLGDSLVYGQGVGDDETLPAYLEESLQRADPGRRWNVINAGHRAYDTRQELALLEELGPELDLDIVIVGWFWNDVLERNIHATFERLKDKPPITFDTGDQVEGWSAFRWHAKQLLRRSALIMFLHDAVGQKADTEPLPEEHLLQAFEDLQRYLERFLALSRRDGFELLFCVLPDARTIQGEHYSADVARRALECVEAAGIPWLSLEEPLRASAEEHGRVPVLPYDGHYDAQGNRAMAAFLAGTVHDLAPD